MRWIIEAVNGRLKNKFKFFRGQIQNSYIPKLNKLLRLACALLNKYSPIIAPSKPGDLELAHLIRERAERPNLLSDLIDDERLNRRRIVWIEQNGNDLAYFPLITEDEIRDLTFDIFQLKQAPSYTFEHLAEEGHYEILRHNSIRDLIRVQIHSRYRNQEAQGHHVYIQYRPGVQGIGGIPYYACTCVCGQRTLGTCSHVASVIWDLGYGRHQVVYRYPAADIGRHVLEIPPLV